MKSNDPSEKIKKRGRIMPNKLILGLSVLFVIVAGISASIVLKRGDVGAKTDNADAADPLINELVSTSPSGLPEYALTSKKTQAGYVVAIKIPGILEKMPCYCSCGAIGHRSLKDCFTKDEGGFGDHASYCDLCVNEALDVYKWQKEGMTLEEIRSRIDEKYSRFGEPTDTPQI